MPFYEREDKILNALLEKDSMTTQELSARLFVSVPTLRRSDQVGTNGKNNTNPWWCTADKEICR